MNRLKILLEEKMIAEARLEGLLEEITQAAGILLPSVARLISNMMYGAYGRDILVSVRVLSDGISKQ
ncbi:hypothetical protein ABZP36_009000 [Zizania latifolia]